jgi:hypothetical protein
MQACAAGYAVISRSALKLQLDSCSVVGVTAAKFRLLYFLCLSSPCSIPRTFGFTWFRITSACVLHYLVSYESVVSWRSESRRIFSSEVPE